MIRLAVPEDFTSIMSIYAYARSFMQETGNPNQWGNHFPPEELIHNRIRDKQLFVLEENGTLHGAFAFIIGEDPTYLQIDDGSWLSDAPYGTIHQVASDGTIHGFFSQIVDYCWAQPACHFDQDRYCGDDSVLFLWYFCRACGDEAASRRACRD